MYGNRALLICSLNILHWHLVNIAKAKVQLEAEKEKERGKRSPFCGELLRLVAANDLIWFSYLTFASYAEFVAETLSEKTAESRGTQSKAGELFT